LLEAIEFSGPPPDFSALCRQWKAMVGKNPMLAEYPL
jgi:hypothetical protein